MSVFVLDEVEGYGHGVFLHKGFDVLLGDKFGRQEAQKQCTAPQMPHIGHVEGREVQHYLALESFAAADHVAAGPQILVVGIMDWCGGSALYLDPETAFDQAACPFGREGETAFAFMAACRHSDSESTGCRGHL